MSELSRFYGIIIRMFYGDHPPPHFHAVVFNTVRMNPDFGCIEWPGGVDRCPTTMHEEMLSPTETAAG